MKNPPAFQFYPADYLADMQVRLLSWASRGLYIELLCYCWREGYIPSDSSAIAQLCGCHDLAMIEPCLKLFVCHPEDESKLVHLRLIAEREKQIEHKNERSSAGKKGAESRWGNEKQAQKKANSSAIAKPLAQPMAKNSSSSSSSSSTSSVLELSKDNSYGKSDLLLRAEKLMNRRASTKMSKAEMRAYKDALPIIKETTEDDWQALESFYASDAEYKRQGFATLLNNWNGEIEKAKAYKQKSVAKPWRKGECQEDNLTIPF